MTDFGPDFIKYVETKNLLVEYIETKDQTSDAGEIVNDTFEKVNRVNLPEKTILFTEAYNSLQQDEKREKLDGDTTKFCGKYDVDSVESVGIEVFIESHPDVREYASEYLGYDPALHSEEDLIQFLKDHLVAVRNEQDEDEDEDTEVEPEIVHEYGELDEKTRQSCDVLYENYRQMRGLIVFGVGGGDAKGIAKKRKNNNLTKAQDQALAFLGMNIDDIDQTMRTLESLLLDSNRDKERNLTKVKGYLRNKKEGMGRIEYQIRMLLKVYKSPEKGWGVTTEEDRK